MRSEELRVLSFELGVESFELGVMSFEIGVGSSPCGEVVCSGSLLFTLQRYDAISMFPNS